MKGAAVCLCGGKNKPNQHYYPTRLVVADAALLAAKSKGLALSLTLSLLLSAKSHASLPTFRGVLPTGKQDALSKEGKYKHTLLQLSLHRSPDTVIANQPAGCRGNPFPLQMDTVMGFFIYTHPPPFKDNFPLREN